MKKGFTLIELLAVIIILAVIALIATPTVLNVIDNAKAQAAKESVFGYADAVKLARIEYMFQHDGAEPDMSNLTITHGGAKVTCGKNSSPANNGIKIVNGAVELENCEVSNYTGKLYNYTNGNVTEVPAS